MAKLRVLAEDDVPAIADLLCRVNPGHGWSSSAACEAYLREVLFANPWRDLELPSWVAEENGRIAGFLCVMPRPMRLRGRLLRVAVGCQFVVDPDCRRSLIAAQLVKAALSGPQALFIADGANDQAQRLWTGFGGSAPIVYNLHWTRPLRPARYALSLLENRRALPLPIRLAGRPLALVADACAGLIRGRRDPIHENGTTERPLDAATMATHLSEVADESALQPAYEVHALDWLLRQASLKTRHGTLRAHAVLDDRARVTGWYLHYVRRGGVSEVLQVAARNGEYGRVLRHLVADARRHGATAVRGRLDPPHGWDLSEQRCWFRYDSTLTLVHSRDPDVAAAIERGHAFLSRLEGEWWLRFVGG